MKTFKAFDLLRAYKELEAECNKLNEIQLRCPREVQGKVETAMRWITKAMDEIERLETEVKE